MNEYNKKKDRIEIYFMKIKIKLQKFLKTKFGAYLWQIVSSLLILAVAGGIGVFAAYAQTEGSSMTYAKNYFKYFMTHSWSLMYKATDLENSKYINEDTFGEMMKHIVPSRGSDKYKFVDRGTDGTYHLIDVVYQETGSDVERTMTLRMKKMDEKSLFILDQWQVCMTDEIIQNCTITAPYNVSITFDGVSLADCEYTDNEETGERTYQIVETLPGTHSVGMRLIGSNTVTETFLWDSSRSSYRVQSTEFPLNNTTTTLCSDKAIDIVVAMYTGALTNAGCDAVKEYFSTDEEKAAVDAVYAALMSQVSKEDGSILITMTFDSYDTSVIDYVSGQSFGIKFVFNTTFSAKGSRTEMTGVREAYQATATGEAVVRFIPRGGEWVPTSIEMNCFDYSQPAETPEQ